MKKLCPVERLFFFETKMRESSVSHTTHDKCHAHTEERERTNQHRPAGLAVAEAESFRVIVKRRINALPVSTG